MYNESESNKKRRIQDTSNSSNLSNESLNDNLNAQIHKELNSTETPITPRNSYHAESKTKSYTSKFKSLCTDPKNTMLPYRDYFNLQKEIAKHFTTTCISSAHIDQTNIVTKKDKDGKSIELRTIKAWVQDSDKYERIIQAGRIKFFLTSKRAERWNFKDRPDQCFKCLQFGHTNMTCRSTQKCLRCGGDDHRTECQLIEGDKLTCLNCKSRNLTHDHAAVSKSCPILAERVKNKEQVGSKFVREYSNAISNNQPGSSIDTAVMAKVQLNQVQNNLNSANVILLMMELFKNINKVQMDVNNEKQSYVPDLVTHYLNKSGRNQLRS